MGTAAYRRSERVPHIMRTLTHLRRKLARLRLDKRLLPATREERIASNQRWIKETQCQLVCNSRGMRWLGYKHAQMNRLEAELYGRYIAPQDEG